MDQHGYLCSFTDIICGVKYRYSDDEQCMFDYLKLFEVVNETA